jgi:hypothetical protein
MQVLVARLDQGAAARAQQAQALVEQHREVQEDIRQAALLSPLGSALSRSHGVCAAL